MWSYYGAKTNIAKYYPKPKHSKIIEAFAGTARYSLLHFEHDVLLVDKYEVIIKIWRWLQKCSEKDITGMPRIEAGQNINDFTFDCEEARLLMGFCIGFGFYSPRQLATPRLRHRPNQQSYTLKRIAANLFKIRHWKIELDSYENTPNEPATWFIDPPYEYGGEHYIHGSKKINYPHLAQWCKEREGQIIVCENSKATWMDFQPMIVQNTLSGKNYESIWTTDKISVAGLQSSIFAP